MTVPALIAAVAALLAPILGTGVPLRPAASASGTDCPESGLFEVAAANWFLANPDHKPDRVASGLREGLRAFEPTFDGRDWRHVDAEPLTDADLCRRVAEAVNAVQLERPANWVWGFFRVEDRIVVVHKRPRGEARIDGPGPRLVGYVIDPDLLGASPEGGAGGAVVGRFESKWWRTSRE